MSDLGVVDPIRAPASVIALQGRIRSLPMYAIGFLLVFVVRATADLYAAARQVSEFGPSPILGVLLGSLPDWLTLLIPVAVGWSALRLGASSGRVVRGAIAVGLSEVVAMAERFIGGAEDPMFAISAMVDAVSFVLFAGGLLWLARGLEGLRVGTPSVRGQRGALLAMAMGVMVAAIELVGRAAQIVGVDASDYADSGDSAILVANAVSLTYVVVPLAWAYLAAVLVRADQDPGRPPRATRLGAWAGWLSIASLAASLASLAWLPFAGETDAAIETLTMLSSILYVVAVAGATIALARIAVLVAALAGGLGSQCGQMDAAEQAGPASLAA
jgi:hypothetical protein